MKAETLLMLFCAVAAFLIGREQGRKEADHATWLAEQCIESLTEALPVVWAADSLLHDRLRRRVWLQPRVTP